MKSDCSQRTKWWQWWWRDAVWARRETRVLSVLLDHNNVPAHILAERTGLSVRVLYPTLLRLERDGRITSEWKDMPEPRLRLYRLVENVHA